MASIMRFDEWQNASGIGTTKLDSAGRLYSPGNTVQTLQTVDTAVTTISSGSNEVFLAYNNLNTAVTPKFPNSKFLIAFQINVGGNGGTSYRAALNINGTTYGTTTSGSQRASSNSIYLSGGLPGDASIHSLTGQYLFQNTGISNVSVTFEIFKQTGSQVIYINRAYTYDDTARGRPASWVTIQEIAQ
jgi:hypothetical protein